MRFLWRHVVILMVLWVLVGACEKEFSEALPDPLLLGTWVDPHYLGDTVILERAPKLMEDTYGLSLRADGSLVERKNAGWCGTPPISYGNFEGTWHMKNDTLLHVNVEYWGGTTYYDLLLLSVDEENLMVIYQYPGI